MDQNKSKLVPALIGGALIGVLSSFPIISAGNCLCCMWVIAGGFLAVYLYKKDLPQGSEVSKNESIIIGLLSGIFGALFASLINYFFMVIGYTPSLALLDSILKSRENISPEFRDMIDSVRGAGFLSVTFIMFQLGLKLFVYSIFSIIGGVIAAVVLNKKEKNEKAD